MTKSILKTISEIEDFMKKVEIGIIKPVSIKVYKKLTVNDFLGISYYTTDYIEIIY